jgi:hypothetical protein
MASRRIPFALSSLLLHAESFNLILNARTAGPTHGGSSLFGSPIAKQTAASTQTFPGTPTPNPEQSPWSTISKTLSASS